MKPCLSCGVMWTEEALNEYQICHICEHAEETHEHAFEAKYAGVANRDIFQTPGDY